MGHFRVILTLSALTTLMGCVPRSADSPRVAKQGNEAPKLEEPYLDTLYDEKPVWESAPVKASANPIAAGIYEVVSGDTLTGIGNRTGAGRDAIIRANDLEPPFLLKIGQKLNIPGGRYHVVAPGESGIAIARAYNVQWSEVVARNDLQEPFVLRVGQRLVMPEKAALLPSLPSDPTPGNIEARAAAFKLNIDDIITGGEPAISHEQVAALPQTRLTRPLPPTTRVAEPRSFSGGFGWPVSGPILARFGSDGQSQRNDGIEIGAPVGTPIKAASDGVVAYIGNGVAGYGGVILLRHGAGWITAYGRAAEATVTRGQAVKRGDIIGRTGDFGTTPTPQLHFEIRKNRTPVDPLRELPGKT